jgi:energy-coupling factor transporter ATP-binding protein EcfA2
LPELSPDIVNASRPPQQSSRTHLNPVNVDTLFDKNEFKRCLSFIIPRSAEDLSLLHSHAIDISPEHKHERYHIYSPELDGKIGVLNVSDGEYYLVRYAGNSDLNLNGQVMLSERVYFLNQGASIRSTKVKPIYYSDIVARFLNSEDKPKVVFRAESLEYKFTENQYGLHTFTFQEESGKMVGIMGASGAGKSTLLNILNGNLAPTSGSITINGFDLYKEKLLPIGTKVFDARFGWGKIKRYTSDEEYPYCVDFLKVKKIDFTFDITAFSPYPGSIIYDCAERNFGSFSDRFGWFCSQASVRKFPRTAETLKTQMHETHQTHTPAHSNPR